MKNLDSKVDGLKTVVTHHHKENSIFRLDLDLYEMNESIKSKNKKKN